MSVGAVANVSPPQVDRVRVRYLYLQGYEYEDWGTVLAEKSPWLSHDEQHEHEGCPSLERSPTFQCSAIP